MTLAELEIGSYGKIIRVGGQGALRQHFLDMGVLPGATVMMVKHAPMGDPLELRIHDYELSFRLDDAKRIEIEKLETDTAEPKSEECGVSDAKKKGKNVPANGDKTEHPGLGEGGKYHVKEHETPLPEETILAFALVGNQNCGKTTLFNQLTGSNQHVGNFPGVTVDRKDGCLKNNERTLLTDLPGIYSMSPYTSEELVTREFILKNHPHGIINIVDATNLERNLYLTMQLLELNVPMVLALNMMDELRENHGSVHVNELESLLGIPVVPISAAKNEGIQELVDHALHVAKYQETPGRMDFCDVLDHGGAVHRCLHSIMHLIEDHAEEAKIPVRFAASKLAEKDQVILESLSLDENEKEMLEHIIVQMEKERGLDRAASIADMRYKFINRVCKQTVVKPAESIAHKRSQQIDRVLTGRFTAIPSFVLIMSVIFFLTFHVIGKGLSDLLEIMIASGMQKIEELLTLFDVSELLRSLVLDGIGSGVGSVLSFLPIIIVLFFFLSMLEDTGYMARVAFVMDKPLRKLGLSGRSIVPLLIGFGCSVPGVMASRTLPSERDRKMTILLTPYMSCSAKLPIYAFLSAAFFKEHAAAVMICLYFGGIVMGIIVALLMRTFLFRTEAMPFVMELPNYRFPGIKNVMQLLWEKAKDFFIKAFTIIFLSSIIIWFFGTFDLGLHVVDNSKDSILALFAGMIAPVFAPLGFGDWRISTALISGFVAKESVVSTLHVLCPTTQALTSLLNPRSASSLLAFCLLYTPCVATIAAVKRELGRKWAWGMVVWQCVVAWLGAFLVYQVFKLWM